MSFYPIGTSELPIFRANYPLYSLFYTPGYLAVAEADRAALFEQEIQGSLSTSPSARTLHETAENTATRWKQLKERPFEPVCLTLYLHNECNLRCRYCYACPSPQPARRLDLQTIRQAAELVASNCTRRKTPFTVAFHGGGEPTLNQTLADCTLDTLEQIATSHQLSLFRYIATNGVMSTAKAKWLARRFDLIGLSCDGPPSIQDVQRPLWGGEPSSVAVNRTAQIVQDSGKPLSIRVTLTRESFKLQSHIADYLCQQFRPQDIHVEPVYEIGRAEDGTTIIQNANEFVSEFLCAESIAQSYGVQWRMSGSRPQDLHGPYCHLFRDVLQLVPGGAATVCFKITETDSARYHGSLIGEVSGEGLFALDAAQINILHDTLQREPTRCQSCFNHYHCIRSCPEYCPLESTTFQTGFRCQIQQLLTSAYLQRIAEMLFKRPSLTGIRTTRIPILDEEPV